MNAPGYLYCFKFSAGSLAKIGVSSNPKSRMNAIRSMLPFDVEFMKVIGFDSMRLAAAWEKHILCNANRHQSRGEWVVVDDKLSELLEGVSGGEDHTEHFKARGTSGRPIPIGSTDTMAGVYRAQLIASTSVQAAAAVKYDGDPDRLDEAIVSARLSEGYGVEDIAALDGIPVDVSRGVISGLRESGALASLLPRSTPTVQDNVTERAGG